VDLRPDAARKVCNTSARISSIFPADWSAVCDMAHPQIDAHAGDKLAQHICLSVNLIADDSANEVAAVGV
jgi:hypothetical protein